MEQRFISSYDVGPKHVDVENYNMRHLTKQSFLCQEKGQNRHTLLFRSTT